MPSNALEFLIPGDLSTPTGGYVYDRRLLAELRALGWKVSVQRLHASFPEPTPAALEHADRVLTAIPTGRPVLIDGLAFSAMAQVLRAHAARLPLVALLHMPLSAGLEADAERLARVRQAEAAALRSAWRVIVTGRGSLQTLRAFDLPAEQIVLIEPGTDAAAPARRRSADPDGTLRLLCVATIEPGKGHELLIEALAPLTAFPWQLTCIGSLTRSPDTVAQLRARVRERGLAARVVLSGELPHAALEQHYRGSDLFVLATRFESYCMAAAEALSYGLPVVSTLTGAMPELVGAQAGRLVPPGNLPMLRAALAAALGSAQLRGGWTEGAEAVRQRLPRWSQAAARVAALLGEIPLRVGHGDAA
jgi:glycosyltransferase involved in cell wall biosynthesis